MTTALRFKSRVALVLAAFLLMSGLTAGMSTPAHAGTADYQYTCQQAGLSPWVIAKGQPLSMCRAGYVQERLNGQLKRTIPLNEAGALQTQKVSTKTLVSCVLATYSTVAGVITAAGGVGYIPLALGVAGLAVCKA